MGVGKPKLLRMEPARGVPSRLGRDRVRAAAVLRCQCDPLDTVELPMKSNRSSLRRFFAVTANPCDHDQCGARLRRTIERMKTLSLIHISEPTRLLSIS